MPAERGAGDDERDAVDEILVEALAFGMSHADAATLGDVSTKTVGRRMASPEFAARVARRRNERVSEITGRLAGLSTEALDVLHASLWSGKAADRIRAAQLVLTIGLRFRREHDLEERLAALEDRLRPGPGHEPGES